MTKQFLAILILLGLQNFKYSLSEQTSTKKVGTSQPTTVSPSPSSTIKAVSTSKISPTTKLITTTKTPPLTEETETITSISSTLTEETENVNWTSSKQPDQSNITTTPLPGDTDWPIILLIGVISACFFALILVYLVMKFAPKKIKKSHKHKKKGREQKKEEVKKEVVNNKSVKKVSNHNQNEPSEGSLVVSSALPGSTGGSGVDPKSKENLKFNSVPMVAPKWVKSGVSEATLWTVKTHATRQTKQTQQVEQ